MYNRQTIAAMVGIMLAFCAGCSHPGQRLLQARIEKDGQPVLQTRFGVPDSWDQYAAWQRLDSQVFEPVSTLKLDPNDFGQLVIKGNIRVTLVHAGKRFAAVNIEQIRLVSVSAGAKTWQLAPGEVDRTAKALNAKKE
ncbi:MAG: hypothetical protein JNL18_03775 [Planctomycetaceae bacterium]|uniref:Uncharacterized protein n=1 Tax=Lacipirellula limnantheis TaxID=2528024 RepID=A0A517U251_9BACT|nr:hypothetical protein [Lacipirellula limnantheis]MBL9161842.1 hypothetical protein [Planctomycetaceae bacterium]QDT74704.1 hypothetical protein I41_39030 [Lacipirellula limnantheis]